ncbi:hypothetical protein BGX33_006690 [Mortierella sp. NVP41]|nr:hypothetical protein BGX33_006690 [Mortierella sp. NVP41]
MSEGRISIDTGQVGSFHPLDQPDTSLKESLDANDAGTKSLATFEPVELLTVKDNLPQSPTLSIPIDTTAIAATAQTSIASSENEDAVPTATTGVNIKKETAEDPITSSLADEHELLFFNSNEPTQESTTLDLQQEQSDTIPPPPTELRQEQQEPHGPQLSTLESPVRLTTPTVSPMYSQLSLEDDEDEGERGTVIILTDNHREDRRRGSIESISMVSSVATSNSCDSTNSHCSKDPVPSSKCNSAEAAAALDTRSSGRPSAHGAQLDFILQPSGFEPHDNIVGTISESLSPSTSSSSASSSPYSSPASKKHRSRPSSHQSLPASSQQSPLIPVHSHPSTIEEDEFEYRHLRHSRSLPSSPKSFSSFEIISLSAFDSPQAPAKKLSEYILPPKLEHELSCDWLPSQHSPTCPLHFGPGKDEGDPANQEVLREESESLQPDYVTSQPHLLISPGERPRRQSMLSPRQLQRLSRQKDGLHPRTKETAGSLWKTRLRYLAKDHHKKSNKSRGPSALENGSDIQHPDSTQPFGQKHSRSTSPLVPSISFQLHQTEISTSRPSVSGRLILHIPRRSGKKFHFVSLALHLRLKESIAWTRHDLFSFEVERHHWAQTVWDKKMMIPFQDRQVEEGDTEAFGSRIAKGLSPAAAIAAAATSASPLRAKPTPSALTSLSNNTTVTEIIRPQPARYPLGSLDVEGAQSSQFIEHSSGPSTERPSAKNDQPINTTVAMDEWRWEWLLPVTRNEVRPESFEGSMGMVWYELEAKCLFRWDDVDKDGNVIPNDNIAMATHTSSTLSGSVHSGDGLSGGAKSSTGSNKLLKGFGASTKKAKSIAQVFGKLRVGNKPKKIAGVGDFNIPSLHEQYIQNSIRKTQEAAVATEAAMVTTVEKGHPIGTGTHQDQIQGDVHDNQQEGDSSGSGTSSGRLAGTADQIVPASSSQPSTNRTPARLPLIPEPIPFLVRRTLKLYFTRPPPKTSSNPTFFLPQPLMSLPTLPSTRRLKAIIPGARIQVQIQVPSLIPIPGYAQSSQLVPSAKTGGLVPIKGPSNVSALTNGNIFGDNGAPGRGRHNSKDPQQDGRYPHNFQAALTIRRVTQQDINTDESLQRRYEFSKSTATAVSKVAISPRSPTTSNTPASGSFSQGFSRTRRLSHQCITNGSSHSRSATEEHGLDEMEEMVTAYPCTDDQTGDRGRHQVDTESPDPLKPIQSKGWRKEIRVRKVKCEFWQKESCRIPTDEAPSHSIKVQLAPVFSYSEKEHEKECQRQAAAQQQSSVSLEPTTLEEDHHHHHHHHQKSSFLKGSRHPSVYSSSHCPTEPPKPWTGRKGSIGSVFLSSHQQQPSSPSSSYNLVSTHTQSNRPFMLLVPIPLDNPRLRQTFSWPSSETPSPVASSAYDCSVPRNAGVESGIGFGSELDYPSHPTMYEMMGTTSRGGGGHIITTTPNSPPVKARIEVKHYLSFRLSLDMLEYEGEPEQDDIDLEAIEEQQLQEARERQDRSMTFDRSVLTESSQLNPPAPLPTLSISVLHPTGGTLSPPLSPASSSVLSTGRYGAGLPPCASVNLSSSVLSTNFRQQCGSIDDDLIGGNQMQPSLSFASISTGQASECDLASDPELFGMTKERRGSKGSLGTVRSATSGNSASNLGIGDGALPTLTQTQASSDLSGGNSLGDCRLSTTQSSINSCARSGGLVAGAIGALKRKASAAGLGNIVGLSTSPHEQQNNSCDHKQTLAPYRVTVQKLKDFVIRVPITIIVQVDDRGKVTSAFGTVNGSSHHNDNMVLSGYSRIDHNGTSQTSTAPSEGLCNITSTTTTTIKNIVTGSSGEPRCSIDPLDSIDTLGSLASMAASAGSESLRRRMDDFATSSSSLAFAELQRHQDQSSLIAHNPLILQQQQQQQQQQSLSQSRSHAPSLLPLTSKGLEQLLRVHASQQG